MENLIESDLYKQRSVQRGRSLRAAFRYVAPTHFFSGEAPVKRLFEQPLGIKRLFTATREGGNFKFNCGAIRRSQPLA